MMTTGHLAYRQAQDRAGSYKMQNYFQGAKLLSEETPLALIFTWI